MPFLSSSKRRPEPQNPRMRKKHAKRTTWTVGPSLLTFVSVVGVAALWLIGLLLVTMPTTRRGLEDFPKMRDFDLWPTTVANQFAEYQQSLTSSSCEYDKNANPCQVPDKSVTTATIFRTPGKLGKALAQSIANSIPENTVKTAATSHLELGASTHLVVPLILPPLLEVMDLVLSTLPEKAAISQIRVQDVLDVLRVLIRWHLRLKQWGNERPILSVSLDNIAIYSGVLEDSLRSFLQLDSVIAIVPDDVASAVLFRVDECTTALATLLPPQFKLNQAVEDIISEEVQRSEHVSLLHEISSPSSVVELVVSFLDNDLGAPHIVCMKYPEAQLCDEVLTIHAKEG